MTKYIGPKTDGENVATQADKLSLSSDTPDALTPDQSGAAGTAVTAARADHQHEILAASAGTITGVSNAEGASTSFARADHTHAISLPRCRAVRSSNQSIPNATNTAVELNAADDYDTDGFHDPASNNTRITIPTGLGGDYLITAHIVYTSGNATGARICSIHKNGVGTGVGLVISAPSTLTSRLSTSTQLSLADNDYLEISTYQNSTGPLNLTQASLEIVRLG